MFGIKQVTALSLLILAAAGSPAYSGDITGVVHTKGARDSRDVVVYLKGVPGKFAPPEKHVLMDQKNLQFIPHVLPVLGGTTVDFRNSDDVLHNVFTPSKTYDQFNLGSWPKGEIRSHTFEAKGDAISAPVLLCKVHPEMEGYVVVLKNPFFAVTDKDGKFAIKSVPAGAYEIWVWHEKLQGDSSKVTVPETGAVTVELNMHR